MSFLKKVEAAPPNGETTKLCERLQIQATKLHGSVGLDGSRWSLNSQK
jgi:hypothetical protein